MTEKEFLQLSPWARVALLARMALRLAPLFEPPMAGPQEATLVAYYACVASAALAARDGTPAGRDLLEPDLQTLEPGTPVSMPSAYAWSLALAAGHGAVGEDISDRIPSPSSFPRPFASAHEAARADFELLHLGESSSSGGPVDLWQHALWPDPDGDWQNAVKEWAGRLPSSLSWLAAIYMELTTRPGSFWKYAPRLLPTPPPPGETVAPSSSAVPSSPAETTALAVPAPTPPPRSGRPRLQMLADRALEDESGDRLDFKPYADAIAGLIDNPETGTPLTIAIHGPWGAGKSTLGNMIQRKLEAKPTPHVTCWFNAWMHDDATDLAAAFAADLSRTADRLRPLWIRLLCPLPTSLRPPGERIRRRVVVWGSVLLLAALLTFLYKTNQLLFAQSFVNALLGIFDSKPKAPDATDNRAVFSIFSLLSSLLLLIPHLTTVARSVSEFVRDPKAPATSGTMGRVRTQLGELIQQATPAGSRFVVFIDDLERCRPPRSVDVLEVVNQLLTHPNVVVVVMADMEAVATCAEIKYKELASLYSPESGAPREGQHNCTYGRLYLQKIVQLQFNLPVLRPEKIRSLLEDLAGNAAPAPDESKPIAVKTAVPPRLPGLLGTASDSWRSEYFQAIREAVGRRPWPRAVVVTPFEILLLPARSGKVWAWRAAYPPALQRVRAQPNQAVVLWRQGRQITTPLYLLSLGAVVGSWPFHPRFLPPFVVPYSVLRTESVLSLDLRHPPFYAALAVTFIALTSFFAWMEARAQRHSDARELRRARELAQESIGRGLREGKALADALGREVHFTTSLEMLIQEGLERYLFNESDLLREAEDVVMPFLPPLPRSAKRILNHLRLMLFIADARKVFGGEPAISARHFGKWVVLQERWPEIARAVLDSPSEIGELEKLAAEPEAFAERVNRIAPWCAKDPDLRTFCAAETQLAGVVERLLHFDGGIPIAKAQ